MLADYLFLVTPTVSEFRFQRNCVNVNFLSSELPSDGDLSLPFCTKKKGGSGRNNNERAERLFVPFLNGIGFRIQAGNEANIHVYMNTRASCRECLVLRKLKYFSRKGIFYRQHHIKTPILRW